MVSLPVSIIQKRVKASRAPGELGGLELQSWGSTVITTLSTHANFHLLLVLAVRFSSIKVSIFNSLGSLEVSNDLYSHVHRGAVFSC